MNYENLLLGTRLAIPDFAKVLSIGVEERFDSTHWKHFVILRVAIQVDAKTLVHEDKLPVRHKVDTAKLLYNNLLQAVDDLVKSTPVQSFKSKAS